MIKTFLLSLNKHFIHTVEVHNFECNLQFLKGMYMTSNKQLLFFVNITIPIEPIKHHHKYCLCSPPFVEG